MTFVRGVEAQDHISLLQCICSGKARWPKHGAACGAHIGVCCVRAHLGLIMAATDGAEVYLSIYQLCVLQTWRLTVPPCVMCGGAGVLWCWTACESH